MPEENPIPKNTNTANALGIPIAIVIAAALIAGAIYFNGARSLSTVDVQKGVNDATQNNQITPDIEIAPITAEDHILGNPNAPIMIVEYSDYDCPFCRIFHDTMTKIMNDFGKDGKVAWVFRHFPIAQLHPSAPKISEAAYCVAELGGNDAFWKFSNALNDSRKIELAPDGNIKSVEPTDMLRISEFAVAGGVDKNTFETCYNSGKYTTKVQEDIAAGVKAGAKGTPYSIIMVGDQQAVINGAQPYEVVKQMVTSVIAQMEGGAPATP